MIHKLLFGFTIMISGFTFGQTINFPDVNFKNALLQNTPVIDTNNDNEIQISEAIATTDISASAKSISDITGIEEFKNLERLNLFNNSISNVDLSENTKLIFLNLTFNSIGEIDLSSNNDLVSLSLSNTSISQINVSNLNDLELLNLNSANLSTIDVSNNSKLLNLDINFTNISSLDISNNASLEFLGFRNTGISSLDFSLLPNLKSISVSNTNFTSLDFSSNPKLCSLSARDCSLLEYIIVKNGNSQALAPNQGCAVSYSIGGGSSTTSGIFADRGNPNLDFICVDDISFAQANFNLVPTQTQFIDNCSSLSVNDSFILENIQIDSPVVDILEIQGNVRLKRVEIYNIQGKKVIDHEVKTDERTISISTLPTGIFVALITTFDKRSLTQKFLKIRN